MSTEQNKAVVRRWLMEVMSGGNLALADELLAPDYKNSLTGFDRAGVKGMLTGMRNGAPDLRIDLENMVAEGDVVMTRFTMQGTHTGSMMGESPTGKKFSVRGLCYYRLTDGKIVDDEPITTPDLIHELGIQMPQASS